MKALIVFLFLLLSIGAKCQTSDVVYDIVEQMPQFPGGEDSMRHFLLYHLQYPENAQKHHIEGRVDIQFQVNEMGVVSNVALKKGEAMDLAGEAMRVVRLFPSFSPGIHDGKTVKVTVVLPIIFQLADFDDKGKAKFRK
jgi:TonB family protein